MGLLWLVGFVLLLVLLELSCGNFVVWGCVGMRICSYWLGSFVMRFDCVLV